MEELSESNGTAFLKCCWEAWPCIAPPWTPGCCHNLNTWETLLWLGFQKQEPLVSAKGNMMHFPFFFPFFFLSEPHPNHDHTNPKCVQPERDFSMGWQPRLASRHSAWLSTLSESIFLALYASIFFPGLHFSLHSCYTPSPPPLPRSSLIFPFSPQISIIRAGAAYVPSARHQCVCRDKINSLQSHNVPRNRPADAYRWGCRHGEAMWYAQSHTTVSDRTVTQTHMGWLHTLTTTSLHNGCILQSSPPDLNEDSFLEFRSSSEALLINSSTICLP